MKRIVLGHNRVANTQWKKQIRNEDRALTREEKTTQMFYVENPNRQNHESSQATNIITSERVKVQLETWRQLPRSLYLRQPTFTTDTPLCISLTLSLTLSLFCAPVSLPPSFSAFYSLLDAPLPKIGTVV